MTKEFIARAFKLMRIRVLGRKGTHKKDIGYNILQYVLLPSFIVLHKNDASNERVRTVRTVTLQAFIGNSKSLPGSHGKDSCTTGLLEDKKVIAGNGHLVAHKTKQKNRSVFGSRSSSSSSSSKQWEHPRQWEQVPPTLAFVSDGWGAKISHGYKSLHI